MSHAGKCFCGSVEFSVTGEPAAMGYCHCSSCRDWSAAPVNAFALWPLDAVKITKGADKIGTYRRTEKSIRKWCKTCGGHLFADLPAWNMVDVFVAVVPSLLFKPTFHVNYQEAVLSIKDELPKQKDLPRILVDRENCYRIKTFGEPKQMRKVALTSTL
jgi:hypothetical protein